MQYKQNKIHKHKNCVRRQTLTGRYRSLASAVIMAEGTVTHIGKRSVVSSRWHAEPGKFCHVSVLDRLMEQNQVKIVYYYPSRGDHAEPGEWIKKLRDSLSCVLTNFPILTGRLHKNQEGHWMVKCNDGGVRMVEAKVKGSVEDWLKSVDREKELKLLYWEEMFHKPYHWPTVYVQVLKDMPHRLKTISACYFCMGELEINHLYNRQRKRINLPYE